MNTYLNMEERLWDYIDGTCSAEEKSFVEKLIESNMEWKAKYKELLEVHNLMDNQLELDEPSLRFTRNVMEEIAKLHIAPATRTYIDKKIIWGIGIFFFALIGGFLIYTLGQINWSTGATGETLPFDLNKMDWSKFFNNTYTNIFMMVNVVLGLMLLDMYLGRRKKNMQERHAD